MKNSTQSSYGLFIEGPKAATHMCACAIVLCHYKTALREPDWHPAEKAKRKSNTSVIMATLPLARPGGTAAHRPLPLSV